jgi:hypothetical protein
MAYRRFWARATLLSREIQRSLPGLTLHDETHFEALWSRVDQIAGPNYCLTPLELFVLGGAILLHDAANSTAVFPGGFAEVEATPEWRDAVEDWHTRRHASNPDPEEGYPEPTQEDKSEILLEALRAIHAERAETLASFEVSAAGERFYLIEDDQLRVHLGVLIGSIAASHHWDIGALTTRLPSISGSLAGMPSDWTVRPVLLACLLRCADATQVDQSRTPDFLYGLLKLRNTSEKHWRAQNRIATPLVDRHDQHALVFTSTRPFLRQDADAWWLAYDALQVANRELQASDSLIRDLGLPPFAINRIKGAESPLRLAQYLQAIGWSPVSAEVKVSRVDKIIDLFGGEKLYGNRPEVSLRELIQNAADAIRFRRELEPREVHYEGAVTIKLVHSQEKPDEHWLIVEDDGLGMSEAVLTGPLIDFGASYVSSALVKAERPGLMSKGRKRIGQFGIGFFSCFMISEEVLVTSRPFDAALSDARTLHFRNGMISRPLLLKERSADYGSNITTRIALKLDSQRVNDLLTFGKTHRDKGIELSLAELVGILCPMLDADIYVSENGQRELVHKRLWMNEDRCAWLRRILLIDKRRDSRDSLKGFDIDEAVGLLTFIDPLNPAVGLACINGHPGLGAATVGTLKAIEYKDYRDEFVGAIDFLPRDPTRHAGNLVAPQRVKAWASEQALKLAKLDVPLPRRQYAAQRIAQFGGDATPIVSMLLNGDWCGIEGIFSNLSSHKALFAPVRTNTYDPDLLSIDRVYGKHLLALFRSGELEYIFDTIESPSSSGDEALYRVPLKKDDTDCSFFSLLERYAAANGLDLHAELVPNVGIARYIGKSSERDGLVAGNVVVCAALKIWACPQLSQN